MTQQHDIYDLINTAIRLTNLTTLADNTAQYEDGLVIVEAQPSNKTIQKANDIIEEHRVLSPLTNSINHFAKELRDGLIKLEAGEDN